MFILREDSETYRVALEAAPLLVIDADFRVRYMNSTARKEYRYEGALPVPCYTLSHGLEEPCPGECPLRSILATGQPRVCIHRHRHEKIQRYEKILASPVYDTRGYLRGIAEILVDITPQIEEERQTRRELESLLEALDTPRLGILILDGTSRVIWANQGTEVLFGLPRDQILGKDRTTLLDGKTGPGEEGGSREIYLSPQGSLPGRWLEGFSHPIHKGLYAGGRVEFYRDITPRKQMELQLQEARKREALCRVAGGLAHQFNNLLMVIQGLSELVLLDLGQEHRLSSHIQRILQACHRGAEIIRKLLSFSGQRVEPEQTLNLSEFLKRAEPLLRSSAGKRIKLYVEVPPEPLLLRGNEEILLQILLPLVANAREAMPRGGELRMKAYRKDQEVCLEIKDTGRGIPEEDLPHIFDPFFTTKELGAGLGLSVVSGSVRALKGRIEVESFPGRGTLFRLYFPSV